LLKGQGLGFERGNSIDRCGVHWLHLGAFARRDETKGNENMANNKTVDSVIADAERLVTVWGENTKFSMGDLTLDGLKTDITKLRTLKQARDEARVKLSKLIDDTNDQMKLIDGYNKRGRSGMKAIFGPDSAQYAQVGGTRQSERKPRSSKKPKTP
jgi:hypothetical protein